MALRQYGTNAVWQSSNVRDTIVKRAMNLNVSLFRRFMAVPAAVLFGVAMVLPVQAADRYDDQAVELALKVVANAQQASSGSVALDPKMVIPKDRYATEKAGEWLVGSKSKHASKKQLVRLAERLRVSLGEVVVAAVTKARPVEITVGDFQKQRLLFLKIGELPVTLVSEDGSETTIVFRMMYQRRIWSMVSLRVGEFDFGSDFRSYTRAFRQDYGRDIDAMIDHVLETEAEVLSRRPQLANQIN